ncbi:hypothetical protein ACFFKU_02565 [Kineococcus gynurae]|uniref:Uncharacterized protein n=1 Tax=Kineococcus gynurae TaxID=452979 RepID=A0ABV5LSG1_9ACTN
MHGVDRAVRRYEQVVDGCPPGPSKVALEAFLPRVDLVARAATATGRAAQAETPSADMRIPNGPEGRARDTHRRLTRTATACAQAAEAAAMIRVEVDPGAPTPVDPARVAAVERAVRKAEELAGLVPPPA